MWIGGSRDGRYYLCLEKLPADNEGIPTVLAIPEIDLFFCSAGPAERIAARVHLVPVSGGLSGHWIEGYLAHIDLQNRGSYLLLIADTQEEGRTGAHEEALATVEQLLLAAMEAPPAT